jgi:glycosyltransferase involved in cell wall biosynthesis
MPVLLVQPWPEGATAIYAAELSDALHRRVAERTANGVQNVENSFVIRMVAPSSFILGSKQGTVWPVLAEVRGTHLRVSALNGVAILLRRSLQMWQVRRVVRHYKPKIVHLLGAAGVGPLTLLTCRWNGVRLVVSVHDLPPRAAIWNPRKSIACGGPGFLFAHRIIVHGLWSREELSRRFGGRFGRKVQVMSLGVFDYGIPSGDRHAIRRRYGLPAEGSVVLFFGSLRRDKGLDVALDALTRVPKLTLFVVAHEPSKAEPSAEEFKRRAASLGVAAQVVWNIGWLTDSEVPDVFAASDFVVLPYTRAFSGQSAVLRVAQHYGLPAVGSDHGEVGAELAVMPGSLSVPPECSEDLSKALEEMRSRHDALGPRVQGQTMERRTWVALADEVLTIYQNCVSSR